jgi:hypothetical protein
VEPVVGGEADVVRRRVHHVGDDTALEAAHPVGEHLGRGPPIVSKHSASKAIVVAAVSSRSKRTNRTGAHHDDLSRVWWDLDATLSFAAGWFRATPPIPTATAAIIWSAVMDILSRFPTELAPRRRQGRAGGIRRPVGLVRADAGGHVSSGRARVPSCLWRCSSTPSSRQQPDALSRGARHASVNEPPVPARSLRARPVTTGRGAGSA